MAKNTELKRRESTIVRHNHVHEVYNDIVCELGKYAYLVPKSYIYSLICERTGLCEKTVAYILNHTHKESR